MSRTVLPSTADDQYLQGFWARMFGKFIQCAREKTGRSIEQTAVLAGICTEEWTSLEAGDLLPISREELRLIAITVEIDWETMVRFAVMCRQAWGVQ